MQEYLEKNQNEHTSTLEKNIDITKSLSFTITTKKYLIWTYWLNKELSPSSSQQANYVLERGKSLIINIRKNI